jgi:hypothetical protein
MAAPDEPNHAVTAAAVVRGEFYEPERETVVGPMSTVTVPEWVRNLIYLPNCFAFRPNVPAHCPVNIGTNTTPVSTVTQFSKYPPTYYLIAGIPSLFVRGADGIYAMRMAGAMLSSALIALGLFLLSRYHPRRLLLLGALISLSPMVLFIMSVLNASALEVASAFLAWCGGLCIVERRDVPRSLVLWTTVGLVLLTLSRPTSPINAILIVVVLGIFAGRLRVRELATDRTVRPLWMAFILALGVSGLLLVTFGSPALLGSPPRPRLDAWQAIWLSLRLTGSALRQCIGDFGWLDTPVPLLVVVVWSVAIAGMALYGLVVSRRCRRALPLLLLVTLATRLAFETPRIDAVNAYWQGRYWLPLLLGIPLVASAAARRPRTQGPAPGTRRAFVTSVFLIGSCLIWAQVSSFLTALRRYQTGLGAPAAAEVRWLPPGGDLFVTVLFISGQVLLLALVLSRWNSSATTVEHRNLQNVLIDQHDGDLNVSARIAAEEAVDVSR